MSDRIVYAVSAAVIVEWELVAAQVRMTGLAGSTTVRVFDEANTLFSTPSITELSLGGSPRAVYQASFTPDAVGQWHVTIDETTGPFAISESYEVVAAADVDSARLVTIQADTDNLQTRIPAALISGRMDSSVGAMANDVVTSAVIATDAIGSDELAASAVTEIQTGLATSAALAAVQADTDNIQTRLPGTLTSGGRMRSQVEVIDAGVITAATTDATFVTEVQGAADAALVGRRLDELIDQVASPVTPTIDSFIDRMTSKDGTQSYDRSTDSLEAVRDALAAAGPSAPVIAAAVWNELRAGHVAAGSFGEGVASVQGNVTGSVASVGAGGITAASIATDAIDSDAIAASAVTEIQSGLATSASIVTLQADTDDIQARLPATLSGGRMRSQVEGMDAGTVTAASIATGAIDADALAADAGTEIGAAVDVTLTAAHGAGAWGGGSAPTVAQIVDGVLDEILAGHLDAGSVGEAISDAAAGGAGLTEQQVANAGLLTPVGVAAPGSLIGNLDEIMGPGFDPLTDSLEEIRDQVDFCCAGGATDEVNVEGI